jgi:Tfp pilus assembly protein PilN
VTALKTNINLLSQDEFASSPVGKFFKWALTIGKYIVIITQLVVITAFVYRFKLDRDLEALNDSIMEQQTIINSFKDLEHNVRVLQNQLNTLKVVTQNQTAMEATLTSLGQVTPLQIELETLSLTPKSVNITGRSLTEAGLATLISGLQQQPTLSDITVNSVSTGGAKDPTLSFTLTAAIQPNTQD